MKSGIEEVALAVGIRQIALEAGDFDRANKIDREIRTEFILRPGLYPVDFILETITKFGDAPQVVYDDDGNFAVSGISIFPLSIIDKQGDGYIKVIVQARNWFPSIREALHQYLIDTTPPKTTSV
jgi:hypothetical protein